MNHSTKYFFNITYTFYIILLVLPCSELALRILGYQAYRQQVFHIEARPENCIIADPELGFALHPGDYEVTINEGLRYFVQHGQDSLRFTGNTINAEDRQDSIYFFGCSYTYGMGVSDSLTFPFLIQQKQPNSYIRNFGVPGYGTIQSYLQLKQLIKTNEKPTAIIINYASFHDDRNALTPAYRRDLFMGFQASSPSVKLAMQQASVPFVGKKAGVYQLQFCEWKHIYESWQYREIFAFVNFLQDFSDRRKANAIDKKEATLYIFSQIKDLCDQYNIRMLVTGITPSIQTKEMLHDLEKMGVQTFDIAVDLSSPKYTNAPYDDHPNAKAHAIFAEKLLSNWILNNYST